jgi:5-methylcytosine-specific restriction endonuclease McrA
MICSNCFLDKPISDYYSGKKQCKTCYSVKAKSRNAATKESRSESGKQYYKKNAEVIKARSKAWYYSNRDKSLKANKLWAANNPIRSREIKSRWKKNHPAQVREEERRRYAKNPEKHIINSMRYREKHLAKYKSYLYSWNRENRDKKLVNAAAYRARKLNAPGDGVSTLEWADIVSSYDNRCAYCASKGPVTMDHIVPLSTGGRHAVDNVVPACHKCNCSKGNKPMLVWMHIRNRRRPVQRNVG